MNNQVVLQTGTFLASAEEAGRIVVGVHGSNPVYLSEVATVVDGPEEPRSYVLFGSGNTQPEAAVTLSVAKRPGANAVHVVETVLHKVESLKGTLIPPEVEITVTRDYGETAAEKSNELLLHMGIAVFGVALLILLFLGWRESIIVLLAIPSTLSLTLLLFYLYGYTLNRITLFALIFSIGILVDDAIVVVENIVRHLRLPANQRASLKDIAVAAVIEVGNPTILATWAVIAAILPMAFVGGLMGPYMRPIPIGASAAMIFLPADRLHHHPLGRHPYPAPPLRSDRQQRSRSRSCPQRLVHPALPPDHGPAAGPRPLAVRIFRPDRRSAAGLLLPGCLRQGQGEDAAL
jgi:multidrug efflux pump subunit AcrB